MRCSATPALTSREDSHVSIRSSANAQAFTRNTRRRSLEAASTLNAWKDLTATTASYCLDKPRPFTNVALELSHVATDWQTTHSHKSRPELITEPTSKPPCQKQTAVGDELPSELQEEKQICDLIEVIFENHKKTLSLTHQVSKQVLENEAVLRETRHIETILDQCTEATKALLSRNQEKAHRINQLKKKMQSLEKTTSVASKSPNPHRSKQLLAALRLHAGK